MDRYRVVIFNTFFIYLKLKMNLCVAMRVSLNQAGLSLFFMTKAEGVDRHETL